MLVNWRKTIAAIQMMIFTVPGVTQMILLCPGITALFLDVSTWHASGTVLCAVPVKPRCHRPVHTFLLSLVAAENEWFYQESIVRDWEGADRSCLCNIWTRGSFPWPAWRFQDLFMQQEHKGAITDGQTFSNRSSYWMRAGRRQRIV